MKSYILILVAFLLGNYAYAGGKSITGSSSSPVIYDHGIIVKFKDNNQAVASNSGKMSMINNLLSSQGMSASHQMTLSSGSILIKVQSASGAQSILSSSSMNSLSSSIQNDPSVEYAHPNYMQEAAFAPNDPFYPNGIQWHYYRKFNGSDYGINVEPAWDIADGENTIIAVIDSGSTNHPDLVANQLPGYDFIMNPLSARDGDGRDSNPADEGDWNTDTTCGFQGQREASIWHGTHVSGTVAAVTDNANGVAGVVRKGKVVHARVLGKCNGALSDIADAIRWSSGASVEGVPNNANPADVINLSLNGYGTTCPAEYQNAIDVARNNGSIVVAAAGNQGLDASLSFPSNCNGVIAVGATDINRNRVGFSNFGTTVDVAAPGTTVQSTINLGVTVPGSHWYTNYAGTSMSTPHVAGVAALLRDVAPNITADEAESIIKSTVTPITPTNIGSGLLNAGNAVNSAKSSFACPAGYTEYRGHLSGAGDIAFLPSPSGSYLSNNSGNHTGLLRGSAKADFDIRAFWSAPGGTWSELNIPNNNTSEEEYTMTGGAGYYHAWQVISINGAGNFQFCLQHPG